MIKKLLLSVVALVLGVAGASAQILTTTPFPVSEDTEDLVVYYHADQGNKVLMGLPASTQIYAHTGVLTSKSTGTGDWKYAPTWGDNDPKYLLTYVSPNLYSLNIGNIRSYYGITDPTETIKSLAFVFRTADKSKEGKTATGGDIFLDLVDSGLQVSLVSSLGDKNIISGADNTVHFTLGCTQKASLSLLVNGKEIASASDTNLLEADYTFAEPATYTVTGKATLNGEEATTETEITYIKPSPEMNFPGGVPKMGQTVNEDGSVTFCIAAPGKESVIMVGNWTNYVVDDQYVLSYQDYNGFRYFWITLPDIDPTKQYIYYYLIDGEIYVGDPYAKLVLDPSFDKYISSSVYPDLPSYPSEVPLSQNIPLAIYQGNLNDYNWTDDDFEIPSKTDLIIYELLFRDFTGTEGKAMGNGTVKLALEKIPYLKKLGVNVIELLPINEFNGNNSWGYNPNFYFAPDKAYGTPDDYKEFINTCHENGIAVVLDMVFNQSDWMHPWYQMYPVGQNPFYNATAPHAYSVLNDWNQGYGLVREQWKDVVQYWINEYHVDGYRFDLVKGLGDNDSYANNGDAATNAYNESRVKNMHQIQEWMEEVNPDALCINENLAGAKEENEMAAYGQLNWYNLNDPGCQFAMGYQSNSSLSGMLATNTGRTWGSTVSYLESHDEQRLAYKQDTWGVEGAVKGNLWGSMRRLGSAAAQMIMAPGSHMIWQFSELGNNENTKNDSGNNTSPKEVLWTYYNVPARYGLYCSYAELIKTRLLNPELFSEEATYALNFVPWTSCRYFNSTIGDKELHLIVNPALYDQLTYKVDFNSANPDDYVIATKSYGSEPVINFETGEVTVAAGAYVVIVSSAVDTGIDEITSEMTGLEPVSEEWYTLTGARVMNPDKGIFIHVVKYADGNVRSFKEIR